jgi:hypothetical protein
VRRVVIRSIHHVVISGCGHRARAGAVQPDHPWVPQSGTNRTGAMSRRS